MKPAAPRDLAASVRQRLLNLAKSRGEDFNFVLIRYALERLLYRLSQSRHADAFILKGAMLFPLWAGSPHRATKDMDLLGHGPPRLDRLAQVFREISTISAEDGLSFLPETVEATQIREGAIYDGIRVTMQARLGNARVHLQVDVGFGDAVTPEPQQAEYPTLLDMPAPRVRIYPREAVIAEKLQAMVELGLANSRMKDFFDVWFLSRHFEFDSATLASAIRATFDRRKTPLPAELPTALTAAFAEDRAKQTQWRALGTKGRLAEEAASLADVVAQIRGFLEPVIAAAAGRAAPDHWKPAQGWH
jgi:predicted nucleotidyltransferase component of viral defense system